MIQLDLASDEQKIIAAVLENLMASMDAGTLFLDAELQITCYTPQVEELFNLKPSDLGRPISDRRQRVNYEELEADAGGAPPRGGIRAGGMGRRGAAPGLGRRCPEGRIPAPEKGTEVTTIISSSVREEF